jgi:anti-sigma28 factor (negative regulator of flagellin synthesis)
MTAPREGGRSPREMDDRRMDHVNRIRERLARDEYRVDASAVAEAIVRRLLAAREDAAERR